MEIESYTKAMGDIYEQLFPLLKPKAHCVINVPDMWWENKRITIHVSLIEELRKRFRAKEYHNLGYRQTSSEKGATMNKLSESQLKRQDFVDNAIYELLHTLNPSQQEIEWDIEVIGGIRDVIRHWLVERLAITDEMTFIPIWTQIHSPDWRRSP